MCKREKIMNNKCNYLTMKNSLFSLLFLTSLSFFSQEKKLITYRKTIVSPTYNLVLKNKENYSQIDILNKKATDFSINAIFSVFNSKTAIAAFNEKLWIANDKKIDVANFKSAKQVQTIEIPDDIIISQIAIGFDDVAFVIDNQKKSLFILSNGKFDLLIEDSRLTKTSSMLIFGGTTYIGTENSILAFGISDKKISVYAPNLDTVLGLETDHVKHIIALTSKEVLRINSDKKHEVLMKNDKNYVSFSMNPESKQLFLLDNQNKITSTDYLKLTNESAQEWKIKSNRKMKPFETKDLFLVGSEYIIHSNDDNPNLRELFLEGFYPEKGKVENGELSSVTPNKKTMECAEKSYQAFLKWSKKVSVNFKNTTKNTPPTFWLMVNDYSEIKGKILEEQRKAKVWYWKRKPAVIGRFPGFWKWEAVLNQDCKCELPNEIEAEQYFKDFIKTEAKL
jgi:hypothetical protein